MEKLRQKLLGVALVSMRQLVQMVKMVQLVPLEQPLGHLPCEFVRLHRCL
jgi:hypothetical protein